MILVRSLLISPPAHRLVAAPDGAHPDGRAERGAGERNAVDIAESVESVGGEEDGFPGTQGGTVPSAFKLVSDNTVVFVPDADDDLTTHESFPTGVQIKLISEIEVRDTSGINVARRAVASTTVKPNLELNSLTAATMALELASPAL